MRRAFVSPRRTVEQLEARIVLAASAVPSLLVQLHEAPDRPGLALFAEVAATEGATWDSTGIDGLYQVSGGDIGALASRFRGLSGVRFAEPSRTMSIQVTPNDPRYGDNTLWGLSGTYGIAAPGGWDVATDAGSVVIADIDTGIDYRHPDLYKNIWINQAEIPADRRANLVDTDGDGRITFWDLNETINQGTGKITDQNANGRIDGGDLLAAWNANGSGGWADGVSEAGDTYVDDLIGWNFVTNTNNPLDDHNHGTHTMGTIAGIGNNATGVAGVAWKAEVMVLKFLDSTGNGSDMDAALAIRYAALHGSSLSSNSWGSDDHASVLYDAIAFAGTQGSLFIAAAGNNGRDTDATPFYPASYTLDNIVSVASTTSSGSRSSFSNYGLTSVDLAAPGSNIYSTTRNGGYGTMSGTSMATPHVAGAAALVQAQNPTWTYAEIKNHLLDTASPLTAMAGKSVSGGLLNLASALEPETPPPPPAPAAPAIANAGFESPKVTTYAYNPSGGSWTFSGSLGSGSGVTANKSGFTGGNPVAPEGVQVAFLQGKGTITQAIAGWSAGTYRLTFQSARRGNNGGVQDFRVLVDGVAVGTFAPSSTSYGSYATEAFTVAAGSHTVRFEGLNTAGGDTTAFLDAVKVEISEPPPPPPPAPAAPVIANAGFESPKVTTYAYNPSGGSWTFSGSLGSGSGVTANKSGFTGGNPVAPEGVQVAFLQGKGTITQAIAGWSAGTYRLTFQSARRGNNGGVQDFRVLVDGVAVGTFAPSSTSYGSYATEAFTVAAGSHTVRFSRV